MAIFYGETMAKVFGKNPDAGKAPAADFGGKLRIINERISLVPGFAFQDTIIIGLLPKGARLINIEMQADVDLDPGTTFSLGNTISPELYGVDLEFFPGGTFYSPYPQRVAYVAQLGYPAQEEETLTLTIASLAGIPPNPFNGSIRIYIYYAID